MPTAPGRRDVDIDRQIAARRRDRTSSLRERKVAAAHVGRHFERAATVSESVERRHAARRVERQRFGDDVGEAGVFDRPRRAAVDRDEDAEVCADIEPRRI